MGRDKGPYDVRLSGKHPGEWAVYRDGVETSNHSTNKGYMKDKAATLNTTHKRRRYK